MVGSWGGGGACWLIGGAVYVAGPELGFFSVGGWGRLLVYFILGVGLNRFETLSRSWLLFGVGAAVLAVSTACYQLALFGRFEPADWMPWITLGCGLGGTFMLFRLRFIYKPLAWLGGFAFTIYLLHSFGVVASRMLGKKILGIDQTAILFAICLVLGLAPPSRKPRRAPLPSLRPRPSVPGVTKVPGAQRAITEGTAFT